ncbi:DNA repair protein RadC [Aquincola sp. S2]|uniref:DNA repair protein RadC n=1 Tax=Pseudaquabacterium terrae TaxID=2732868 RepID=A0ABX2ESB0_9BURK|nr:DNA repair protein RadC [Aquabacterium terrae]NRF71407.1 DNA repair protein RadC [Aquabacterium terrae]
MTRTTALFVKDLLGDYQVAAEDEVIAEAKRVLERRVRKCAPMSSPQMVQDYLAVQLSRLEYEVFVVMFLDAQHRLIEMREMFRGTLSQTSVYPREVVRAALQLNAGAIVVAHNHPSGEPEPSRADEFLTSTLKTAMQLVDVRLLDHMIVGGARVMSFAERGLL